MSKIIATALLIATLPIALTATPAQAEEHTGIFVDGRLGSARTDDNGFDDNSFAGTINAGYRWGYWGVDVGYANFNGFGDHGIDLDVDGFTAGMNARFNVADQWYVSARGGAFFWDSELQFGASGLNDDGTDYYAGVGAGYDFSKRFSAGLSYDFYKVSGVNDHDVGLLSANAEVRF